MWKYGEVDGFVYDAEVDTRESRLGINGGRVLQLRICDLRKVDRPEDMVLYLYQRGNISVDKVPDGVVDKIVALYGLSDEKDAADSETRLT